MHTLLQCVCTRLGTFVDTNSLLSMGGGKTPKYGLQICMICRYAILFIYIFLFFIFIF